MGNGTIESEDPWGDSSCDPIADIREGMRLARLVWHVVPLDNYPYFKYVRYENHRKEKKA